MTMIRILLILLIAIMLTAGCDEEGNSGSDSSFHSNPHSLDYSYPRIDYYCPHGSGTDGNGNTIPNVEAGGSGAGGVVDSGNPSNMTPEPSTIVLLGVGLAGLAYSAFRRKRAKYRCF